MNGGQPTSTRQALPGEPARTPRAGDGNLWFGLLALGRVSNLPTVWMNVLTAVLLSSATAPFSGVVVLLLSMSAFYTAGMTLNDVFDADFDAISQPYRPIPRGQVTMRLAVLSGVILLVGGLALLIATPFPSAAVLGLVLAATILAYDRFHKASPWTVVLMAACRLLVFGVCAWAMTGAISAPVAFAATIQFVYTLGLTALARRLNQRDQPSPQPLVPRLIAGMCVVDGLTLTLAGRPEWLVPATLMAFLTRWAQKSWVRGD